MTDTAFANALKRQDELKKELAEIEQFLLLYRRFERTGQEHPAISGRSLKQETFLPEVPSKIGPTEYADMAANLIRDARRPLTRGEIADELKKRGVVFPTEDVPRYLGTILWRNRDRFINVPGLGYALQDIMTPEYVRRIHEANARSAEISEEVRDVLVLVAARVVKGLDPEVEIKLSDAIPPDIDRRLLSEAGEELGRSLYEPEKIALREAFKLEVLLS